MTLQDGISPSFWFERAVFKSESLKNNNGKMAALTCHMQMAEYADRER